MPTPISKNPEWNPADLSQMKGSEAREILKSLKVQTSGKSGTLNLVFRGGEWQIRRQNVLSRFLNFFFQKSLGPEETRKFLLDLVGVASSGNQQNPPEELPPGMESGLISLGNFLAPGREIDAKPFSELLTDVYAQHREDLSLGECTKQLSTKDLFETLGWEIPLMGDPWDSHSLTSSGSGGFGWISDIPSQNFGKPSVFKKERKPVPVRNPHVKANPRGRELAAAYLFSHKTGREVPNVCTPSHFVFQSPNGKFYLVPAAKTKAFLKATNTVHLVYVGQVIPKAPGKDLLTLQSQGEISPEDKKLIAKQGLEILINLNARGFVHHDIKPDNFVWDSGRKVLTLVDTGMLQKLSKNPSQDKSGESSLVGGTPFFAHPQAKRGDNHSTPVDSYSLAMTLLDINLWSEGNPSPLLEKMHQSGPPSLTGGKSTPLASWLNSDPFTTREKEEIPSRPQKPSFVHEEEGSEESMKELSRQKTSFLENLGTEGPKPTFEDFCNRLLVASQLDRKAYGEELQNLRNHPYLSEK